jgi:hypothetical protein
VLAAPIQNRTLSLSNLLDVGIVDLDEMVSQPGDKDEALETDSQAASVAKRRVKSVPQWKRKQHVIEAINDLIDELDNILQSITIQGVEHIHAKEVRRTAFYITHSASGGSRQVISDLSILSPVSGIPQGRILSNQRAPCTLPSGDPNSRRYERHHLPLPQGGQQKTRVSGQPTET